jgi:hypothetical protein
VTTDDNSRGAGVADRDARRLVLGAAVGFPIAKVRVFVESLRQVGYGGDVVMLVGPFQFRLKAYLRRFGVKPVSSLCTRKLTGPIHAYRFEKFAGIAAAAAGRYDQILVSDVRDVVFQKHPFEGIGATGCHFFLEGDNRIIAEEAVNLSWMRKFLPPDEVERIGTRRVSCCGVVMGDATTMTDYLRRIAGYLHALPLRLRREGGADTVFHNRMAHLTGEVACDLVENNVHVATMGLEGSEAYRAGEDGLIHTASGHLPAILHQYDRIPHTRVCVESRFP